MLLGSVFILLSLLLAVGGYHLRKRYYSSWDQARIGAVDSLFSWQGVLSYLRYALFHFVWFFATAMPFILGLIYLIN